MQDLLLFIVVNALLAGLCLRLGSRLLSDQTFWRRVAGSLLLFPAIAGLCCEILDGVGPVTALRAAALLFIALLAEIMLPRSAALNIAGDTQEKDAPALRELILWSGLFGLWITAVRTTLWQGTFFVWDDLTYHAAIPGYWLQTASLAPAPFTYQAYFPLNSELFSYWFMLPLGDDSQVGFALLFWISIGLASFLAIGRNLKQDASLTIVLASFMLISPNFIAQLKSFSGVDLAVVSLGLAALAFARSNTDEPSRATRDALFSGIAAGMAAGAKTPFLVLCALLAIWWLAQAWERPGRERIQPAVTFVCACLVCGGYWYLRNWILTGNPFFPAEIGPFAGPLDRVTQTTTSMAGHLNASGWNARTLLTIVKTRLKLPMPLGVLFAAGLLLAPLAVARGRKSQPNGSWRYLALVAGCGLLLLVLHPFQPFSGTVNRPKAGLQHNVRFILASVAIGWAVFPSLVPKSRAWTLSALIACTGALAYTLRRMPPTSLEIAGAGAVVGLLVLLGWRRQPHIPFASAIPSLALVALVAVAFARTPTKADLSEGRFFRAADFGRMFDGGWRALDDLPGGYRVAYLSNLTLMANYYYPQFGRSLQHVPIAVGHNGQLRLPLHETWREDSRHWWWEFRREDKPDPALVDHLRAAGVEFILVNRLSFAIRWYRNPDWPAARTDLHRSPRARLHYADEYSEIYDLR